MTKGQKISTEIAAALDRIAFENEASHHEMLTALAFVCGSGIYERFKDETAMVREIEDAFIVTVRHVIMKRLNHKPD